MGIPLDSIRRGDFLVIVRSRLDESRTLWDGSIQHRNYDGMPMRVLHVELPFIVVQHERGIQPVDARIWDFHRVSRKYANAAAAAGALHKRKRRTKLDERSCPRCGCRLQQRYIADQWCIFCPNCSFNGGPADATR